MISDWSHIRSHMNIGTKIEAERICLKSIVQLCVQCHSEERSGEESFMFGNKILRYAQDDTSGGGMDNAGVDVPSIYQCNVIAA